MLGVVSQAGNEVSHLRVGDAVWFVVPHCVQGSLSSYIVLDQDHVRPLPPGLSFEAGATLPYVGMVCWDLLVNMASLGPFPSSRGTKYQVKYVQHFLLLIPDVEYLNSCNGT